MRERKLALTGPQGVALLGLDGYRGLSWPTLTCSPLGNRSAPGVIRTRRWIDPVEIDGIPVAPAALALRHLGSTPAIGPDGILALDRIELAFEHAMRDGLVELDDFDPRGGGPNGERQLSEVLRRRRPGDRPTASFAETRAAQFLRRHRVEAWRQVPVVAPDGTRYRSDFLLPYRAGLARPKLARPGDGLLFEVDGKLTHEEQTERDYVRNAVYDALGIAWVAATPFQIEHQYLTVVDAIATRLRQGQELFGIPPTRRSRIPR